MLAAAGVLPASPHQQQARQQAQQQRELTSALVAVAQAAGGAGSFTMPPSSASIEVQVCGAQLTECWSLCSHWRDMIEIDGVVRYP
jgi:type II secretory pathway pseudopilin PulG